MAEAGGSLYVFGGNDMVDFGVCVCACVCVCARARVIEELRDPPTYELWAPRINEYIMGTENK